MSDAVFSRIFQMDMQSLRNQLGILVESVSRGDIHAIQITVPDPNGTHKIQYRTFIQGSSESPLRVFSSCQDKILTGPLFRKALKSDDVRDIENAIVDSIELAGFEIERFGLRYVSPDKISSETINEIFEDFEETIKGKESSN